MKARTFGDVMHFEQCINNEGDMPQAARELMDLLDRATHIRDRLLQVRKSKAPAQKATTTPAPAAKCPAHIRARLPELRAEFAQIAADRAKRWSNL